MYARLRLSLNSAAMRGYFELAGKVLQAKATITQLHTSLCRQKKMSKLGALRRTQTSTADSVANAVAPTAGVRKTLRPRPVLTESTSPGSTPLTSGGVERINVILPLDVLEAVDQRIASLGRKKKVSVSGYIEAALRELLATGEGDVAALERYRITARRKVSA
jgi:hypothetical protein